MKDIRYDVEGTRLIFLAVMPPYGIALFAKKIKGKSFDLYYATSWFKHLKYKFLKRFSNLETCIEHFDYKTLRKYMLSKGFGIDKNVSLDSFDEKVKK